MTGGVRAYSDAQPMADMDALVRKHADLVKRIAYHLAGRLPPQVEVDDLIQAGMIGLLEAAQNYASGPRCELRDICRYPDPWCDARCVAQAGLGAALGASQSPRRSRCLAGSGSPTRRGSQRFGSSRAHGRAVGEYQRIVQDALGCQLLRLNDADDGDESALDRLVDGAPDPESSAMGDSLRQAIIKNIQELPERERLVLSLYYEQELNLKEIGAVLKVTESRVCQLHGQALLRLKAQLSEWHSA
jgi:RNA polymerase sigma factor for flagellar operon FliA